MTERINKIGASSAIALVVGSIVGTGIFVTPSMVAKFTTDFWIMSGLWILGGLLCLIGGDIYGRLGQKFPFEGGQYVYLEKSLGVSIALIYGWISFLVISPSMIASYSSFFGEQLRVFIPDISLSSIKIIALGFCFAMSLINCLGIRVAGGLERVVVALQILLIFSLFVVLIWTVPQIENFSSNARPDGSLLSMATAIVGILWTFEGFNSLSFVAHEVRESRQKLRLYILAGCGIVFLVYSLLIYLSSHYLSWSALVEAPSTAIALSNLAFPEFGSIVTGALMIVAVTMSTLPAVMIGPRVTHQMAGEGWMPSFFYKLHPQYTSPNRAILTQAFIAGFFIYLGSFESLISIFITVSWIFYILIAIGFLKLRLTDQASKLNRAIDFIEVSVFVALAALVIGLQIFKR